MYDLLYDYVKPNYGAKAKLSYIDIGSFIVDVKGDDICKDTAKDVETRFDISNYQLKSLFLMGKNYKK